MTADGRRDSTPLLRGVFIFRINTMRPLNPESPVPPLLVFEEVARSFRTVPFRPSVTALRDVSFRVDPGSIVGLVGPNGSGKTTTFRIITGLIAPESGRVQVHGTHPGARAARKGTGYMPEQPGLPGRLKPRELMDFVGRLHGRDGKARAERIEALADLLDLRTYLDRPLSKLSKGMSKRVGLACALFHDPSLLLLDEPLEGLDPLGAADVKDHLAERATRGAGILISSHILSDIETMCDEIVILDRGSVLLKGRRDAILAARDRLEVRFEGPETLLDEAVRFIESRGGNVESAGHPREGLERVFRRLLKRTPDDETALWDKPNPIDGERNR